MNIRSKHAISVTAVENALKPAMYAKGKPIVAMNILNRMKYYNVPGVSVAVIDDGKIDWAKGYGVKESSGNDPVTSETLFQAASISKPVTALGTLRLVDQGILDLDSPINDKLVSWKVPENELSEKEKVTLRRLLTHSAGSHACSSARWRKPSQYFSCSHRHDPRISVALLWGRIRGYATSRGGHIRHVFSGIHEDKCSGPFKNDPQHV
jgi:CubicO group peptidase (beta-lactamase class C family)